MMNPNRALFIYFSDDFNQKNYTNSSFNDFLFNNNKKFEEFDLYNLKYQEKDLPNKIISEFSNAQDPEIRFQGNDFFPDS